MPGMADIRAKERWEHRTQGPLLLLSVLFAVAYAVPIMRTDLAPWVRDACRAVE